LILHARLAEEMGVAGDNTIVLENGEKFIVEGNDAHIEKESEGGIILVDGKHIADVGNVVLRDRLHLSQDGVVVAMITVDTAQGKIVGGPDLVTRGFTESMSDDLMNEAKQAVQRTLDGENFDKNTDWNSVKEMMRKSLQKFYSQKSNRRPMILPVVMEM